MVFLFTIHIETTRLASTNHGRQTGEIKIRSGNKFNSHSGQPTPYRKTTGRDVEMGFRLKMCADKTSIFNIRSVRISVISQLRSRMTLIRNYKIFSGNPHSEM